MKSRCIPLFIWTLTLGVCAAPSYARADGVRASPAAGLRRLDTDAPSSDEDSASEPDRAPAHRARRHPAGDDDVNVIGSTHVEAGRTVDGDAVAVMGSVTVDGHVTGDAVAVMGDNTINGLVDGDAVCVMGDLTLGPKAHVGHDVTCVMGTIHRDPGAIVDGGVNHSGVGVRSPFAGPGARNWWSHGLSHGSVMAFGPHLVWLWFANMILLVMYAVIALAAPNQTRRCGDLLRHRPGLVILSAFLGAIAFPIVFVLLCITIVGLPVALLLLPAAFLLTLFGKGSVYGLIGRGITGDRMHPAGCVLLGGVICVVFLLLPVVGVLFFLLLSFLGWGCGVAAILTAKDGPSGSIGARPSPAPAVAAAAAPVAAASYGAGLASATAAASAAAPVQGETKRQDAASTSAPAAAESAAVPPVDIETKRQDAASTPATAESAAVPPPVNIEAMRQDAASTLDADAVTAPRAGFWIRTAGLLIDAILIGFLTSALGSALSALSFGTYRSHGCGFGTFLLVLATYGAVLWKLRNATIGGLICNLRVVRLDGRPVDWPTAVVRALGCFVSLLPVGLGFIWVAFDPHRQSWHDKIAGTTVVQPARRRSLV